MSPGAHGWEAHVIFDFSRGVVVTESTSTASTGSTITWHRTEAE